MNKHLEVNLKRVIRAFKTHGVERAYVFGSAALKGEALPQDYDFLLSFSPEIPLLDYADNYLELKFELEAILGMPVDLVSDKSLKNPVFKEEVLQTRIPIYEAA